MVQRVSTIPTRDLQYPRVGFQSQDKFQEICFCPWLPRSDDSQLWIKSDFVNEILALARSSPAPDM